MESSYDDISEAGAEVLAISTDDLSGAESIVEQRGLRFPVLYTAKDNSVPEAYEVFDLHGDGLASASVFIIDTEGKIAWESIGQSTSHQVAGDTIAQVLTRLQS